MMKTLTVTMPDDRTVRMTRTFAAPRQTVWEAMIEPALLRRWLSGPPGWQLTECVDDLRAGGSFRWVWTGPAGEALTMTGTYRAFEPPARSVRTERFEGPGCPPMAEQLATLELAEQGAGTLMTITLEYDSKEARDGAMASGMEGGMEYGYANLDALLAG